MRAVARCIGAAAILFALTTSPVPAAPLLASCEKTPGFLGGPFVPDAKTAEGVYRSVANAIAPGALERYPPVVVTDEGSHWLVGQARNDPPKKPKSGEVEVSFGGGQLSMKIEKCSGAISSAYFNR